MEFKTVSDIRKFLDKHVDEVYKKFNERIIPGSITIGVRMPNIDQVVKSIKKNDNLLELIEELWNTKIHENQIIAEKTLKFFDCKIRFEKAAKWLKDINNWASCDTLYSMILSECVVKNHELIKTLDKWTDSKNVWERRAGLVSLIKYLRDPGTDKKPALAIIGKLMKDDEMMIKKATDWMIRELAKKDSQTAFEFCKKWIPEAKKNKHTRYVLVCARHKLEPKQKKEIEDLLER